MRSRWEPPVEEADFSDYSTKFDLREEIIEDLADRIFRERDWRIIRAASQIPQGSRLSFSMASRKNLAKSQV
ncbi:MAG: hypothetical protein KME10_03855 [Plectolyngbya sp. WJT66-NPBG17]|nr:hypothetical protein [Plectolyngbya sp. WJT66-NPBG17]MBW4528073.1 hypothetical protein [Phormidium tanganyikae FI6-MK23]